MNNPFLIKHHYALVDSQSFVVLTLGRSMAAMVFLSECIPDAHWISAVQHPNYSDSLRLFFIESIKPEEYTKWTWDYTNRLFLKTNKELVDKELPAKSRLAEGKRIFFQTVMNNINLARLSVITGADFQETVYLTKKMQAQAFKESGYDENLIMEFPYVVQYADLVHISMKQAAEDILLKAKFDDELLAKTELLRLKYINKLKEVDDPNQLPSLLEDFLGVCYVSAQIKPQI